MLVRCGQPCYIFVTSFPAFCNDRPPRTGVPHRPVAQPLQGPVATRSLAWPADRPPSAEVAIP